MEKKLEENLMDFNSPLGPQMLANNEFDSPGSNPFDKLLHESETFTAINIENELFNFSRNVDIDPGRESLGILQFDIEKIKFDDANWSNVPELQINCEKVSQNSLENLSTGLNTAFIYSYQSKKESTSSSIPFSVSYLSNLDLWDMSKIHSTNSVNSTHLNSMSTFNKAFINSCNSDSKMKFNMIDDKNDFLIKSKVRQTRINSLPNVLYGKNLNFSEKFDRKKEINSLFKNFRKSESLFRRSFILSPILKSSPKEDDEFNDSVFIEGNHLASKIADESIFNAGIGELYSLDCTPQPEWVDLCDIFDEENVPNCTDKVFKTVDKMIPSTDDKRLSEDCNTTKHTNNTSSSSSLSRNECIQNLSDIFNGETKKLTASRLSHCSSNSKSKDAKSILNNLSEILSNNNPSAQQKSEGQNLLFSLADILCSGDSRNSVHEEQSEDSGHSSIDHEVLSTNKQEHVGYEILDLRTNVEMPVEEIRPLDLSISKKKRDHEMNGSALSASESRNIASVMALCSNSNSMDGDKNKNEISRTNGKNPSCLRTSISELSSIGKLKPKRIDKKVVPDKGPLKAMIPIGNMSKSQGLGRSSRIGCTPPKSNDTPVAKMKRTSTPKTELKHQPVAQSTPDNNFELKKRIPTPQLRQKRLEGPVSPLTRMNSIGNESTQELNKRNRSGSAPNLSSSCSSKNASAINSSQNMCRRRSASDLKLPKNPVKFRRSNTIDKDSGIVRTINRVRENIEKSRSSSVSSARPIGGAKIGQSKSVLGESNRASTSSNIKPCNLINKMKKITGKENTNK